MSAPDQRGPGDLSGPPIVELVSVTKRFPGVVANDGVDLAVAAGEIHAICGENGAGKSTLMKILYGMQRPDEGQVRIDGSPVTLRSPKDAIAAGIGMVHQHFMLADNLTVLENVILGAEPVRGPGIDFARARADISRLGRTYGLEVSHDELVENLDVGQRQRVEIIKVLFRGARILILDEPTAALVPQEIAELFRNLRQLRAGGTTVIFISHKLDEVLELAGRITVLRRGRVVATVDAGAVGPADLAELMVGSQLPTPDTRTPPERSTLALDVEGLAVHGDGGRPAVRGVSFRLHRGEIVGIAGVEGNGQSELTDALLGLRSAAGGRILLGGDDITDWPTRRRRERGVGYIPEDRHRRGLLLPSPVWENAMLGHQGAAPYAAHGFIDARAARRATAALVDDFDVRTPSIDVAAHALSGGNQQKLIVGRELSASGLRFLIAGHPTRGVDVGAQAAVWDQLRRARAEGVAVLLISSDLDELIGLSDVLHVMFRGRIVATVDPSAVTPADLGSYMTGVAETGGIE